MGHVESSGASGRKDQQDGPEEPAPGEILHLQHFDWAQLAQRCEMVDFSELSVAGVLWSRAGEAAQWRTETQSTSSDWCW